MQKIREFLKKNSWIWIIVVVLAAYIGDILIQKQLTPAPLPSATPAPVAEFKNIVPGVSSETDLNKIWGSPLNSQTANGETTLRYSSTNIYRNHVAIVENGKVVLIREIINSNDNIDASSVTNIYGTAKDILYEKTPQSVYDLYVYPQSGIAYLGAKDGTLKEIWYFQPMSFEAFTAKWGQDYQTAPATNENVY